MKLSERHEPVTKAHLSISTAVCDAVRAHGLTYAELISILSAEIASWTKWQIRDERAPEPESQA